MPLKRFGTAACGKYYPRDLKGLSKESVVYCVGAGRDISHDVALSKELQCKIYIIDPTPKAIEYINSIKNNLSKFAARESGGLPIKTSPGTSNLADSFKSNKTEDE